MSTSCMKICHGRHSSDTPWRLYFELRFSLLLHIITLSIIQYPKIDRIETIPLNSYTSQARRHTQTSNDEQEG